MCTARRDAARASWVARGKRQQGRVRHAAARHPGAALRP
jgi:hypothetical protein